MPNNEQPDNKQSGNEQTNNDDPQAGGNDGLDDGPANEEKRKGITRRTFLTHLGLAGVAVASGSHAAQAQEESSPRKKEQLMQKTIPGAVAVSFSVNKQKKSLKIDPRTTLLDCLRENLNITGTKKRLRPWSMRRLHSASRRSSNKLMPDTGGDVRGTRGDDY